MFFFIVIGFRPNGNCFYFKTPNGAEFCVAIRLLTLMYLIPIVPLSGPIILVNPKPCTCGVYRFITPPPGSYTGSSCLLVLMCMLMAWLRFFTLGFWAFAKIPAPASVKAKLTQVLVAATAAARARGATTAAGRGGRGRGRGRGRGHGGRGRGGATAVPIPEAPLIDDETAAALGVPVGVPIETDSANDGAYDSPDCGAGRGGGNSCGRGAGGDESRQPLLSNDEGNYGSTDTEGDGNGKKSRGAYDVDPAALN